MHQTPTVDCLPFSGMKQVLAGKIAILVSKMVEHRFGQVAELSNIALFLLHIFWKGSVNAWSWTTEISPLLNTLHPSKVVTA